MSALSNKINSYALERGIAFEETFSLTPTRTGTNPLGTFTANTGTQITYESGITPLGGDGSWKIPLSTTVANNGNITNSTATTTELLGLFDNEYSFGFWFRLDQLPTGTSATPIVLMTLGSGNSSGMIITVTGSNFTTNPSQLRFDTANNVVFYNTALEAQRWYYLAVRRTATTGTNNHQVYIDGSLAFSFTEPGSSAVATFRVGQTSASSINSFWNISNFYLAPSSIIGATEIGEIWTTGSTSGAINITFNTTPATATALSVLPSISGNENNAESPATASGLQTEPTIVTNTGDNTQVTTSIPVSVEFPPATVSTQTFININIAPATATADIGDNVIVSNNTSVDFSAEEATASAILVKPFLAESPMLASAQSGNHAVYVDPNYQNLITSIGPYLYIHDGSSTPQNKGYQSGTFTVSSALLKNQTAPLPIYLSGEGKSWRSTNNTGQDSSIRFNAPSNETSFDAILATGEWSVESWISTPNFTTNYRLLDDPSLIVSLLNGFFPGSRDGISVTIKNGPTTTEDQSVNLNADGLVSRNTVYHTVITSTMTSSTKQLVRDKRYFC